MAMTEALRFRDESFSFETLRAAGSAPYGGADLGEVLATARLIRSGDEAGWFTAWRDTAERVHGIADAAVTNFPPKGIPMTSTTPTDGSAESLTTSPLAGSVVAENHDGWSPELREEFARHRHDGHVGSRLLFETNRVRVWEIRLAPGQRLHAHRHVLDYFWIASTAGQGRQHTSNGTTRDVSYNAGDSKYLTFDRGEYLLHDLNNIGKTELVFTTVEHLDSANEALPISWEEA